PGLPLAVGGGAAFAGTPAPGGGRPHAGPRGDSRRPGARLGPALVPGMGGGLPALPAPSRRSRAHRQLERGSGDPARPRRAADPAAGAPPRRLPRPAAANRAVLFQAADDRLHRPPPG